MDTTSHDRVITAAGHPGAESSRSARPRRRRLTSTIGLVALAAAVALPGAAVIAQGPGSGTGGGGSEQLDTTEHDATWQVVFDSCMRSAAGSPDAALHRTDACEDRATAFFTSAEYVACLRGMSPDAALRWSRSCVDRIVGDER